jgi:hypothetical protein
MKMDTMCGQHTFFTCVAVSLASTHVSHMLQFLRLLVLNERNVKCTFSNLHIQQSTMAS